jgi:integrase
MHSKTMKLTAKNNGIVRFYLRRSNGDNVPVYLVIRKGSNHDGTLKTIKLPTGITVNADLWNSKTQRVKAASKDDKSYIVPNRMLALLSTQVQKKIMDSELVGIDIFSTDAKQDLRQLIQSIVNPNLAPTTKHNSQDVLHWFKEFIEYKSAKDKVKTIYTYQTTLKWLTKYSTTKRIKLKFDTFTTNFETEYKKYLLVEANLTNNTIAKHFKIIKTFLIWARDEEQLHTIRTDKIFKSDEHKSEPRIIVLLESELQAIENLNLHDRPALRRIRDIFLLQCYTGLRYSDVMKLSGGNLNGNFISITTEKTSQNITIPLLPKAKEILQQFGGNILPISNQNYNQAIHEVARLAGIDTPTEHIQYKGKEQIRTTHPKYELITSHTARRTFITLSLKKGMNAEIVRQISGHTDYKSFKRYVDFNNADVSKSLLKAWGDE